MNDPQSTSELMSASGEPGSDQRHLPPRVLVVGDQVVAEAVRVALVGRGLSAVSATWRSLLRSGTVFVPTRVLTAVDVGLLISDLDTDARVRNAQQVLAGVALPWLALTGAPRGPLWGALLHHDAQVVRDSGTRLAELVGLLCHLRDGVRDPSGDEREELVAAWDELWRERVELAHRLRSLSPREWEVLRLLYRGEPVTRIANHFGVADSTVRSQVKSMLRKLGVSSQLGAVAAYGMLRSSRPAAVGQDPDWSTPDPSADAGPVAHYPVGPQASAGSSLLSARPSPKVR